MIPWTDFLEETSKVLDKVPEEQREGVAYAIAVGVGIGCLSQPSLMRRIMPPQLVEENTDGPS